MTTAAASTPSERELLFAEIAELRRQRDALQVLLAECRQELREYKGDA
jgi:SepF-like predicted cell division protein (DUF552 family)